MCVYVCLFCKNDSSPRAFGGNRCRRLGGGARNGALLASCETVQEIRLPDEADAVLSAYEELQTTSGLSLLKHSGKRVKLYTYAVIDTVGAKAQAHLYVYRGRVIAGDITAADPDGTQSPLLA